MKKHKTNVQFVKDLMDFSQNGALTQMFVMDAIGKLADAVAAAPPIEHALIDGVAWKRTAQEIQAKLAEHFAQ